MAADRIVRVDVNSNLKEQTAQAKELNRELDRAQKSATKTGSRAADAALGVSTPGITRGASGAGGRGGERDFARQAQGLGGLVHVYATFAANIYAVATAFTALQRAADTENMIRAAEGLSASYGTSLKNISQGIKDVTDNAVSMREALTFANLGASAGLASKQIEDLTKVAKGASIALGRDMTDSLQRVFRGSIKLEPELLDELGIMVKLDHATTEYARSINKTALSLTQFERTQAFVNAVITQGNQKFAEAQKLAANPYSKLLAQLQDVLDMGLRVTNVVLGPIAELLSQTPLGLATALGGLVAVLLRQALPAMDSLVARSTELSIETAASAKRMADDAEASFERVNNAIEPIKLSEKFSNKAQKSRALKEAIKVGGELSDAIDQGINKGSLKFDARLKGLQKSYIDAAQKAIQDAQSKMSQPGISPANRQSQQQVIDYYTRQIPIVRDLKDNIRDLDHLEQSAAKRRMESIQASTKARAYEVTSQLGLLGGLRRLTEDADDLLEQGQRRATVYRSSFITGLGLIARTVGDFTTRALSFVGVWGTVAAVVISGIGLITDKLKWTTKASAEAAAEAEKLANSASTLGRVLEDLGKAKTINEIFKLDTSTLSALSELKTNLEGTLSSYTKFATGQGGGINRFIDMLQTPFGFGTTADVARSAAASLGQTAKVSPDVEDQLRKALIRIARERFTSSELSAALGAGTNLLSAPIEELVYKIALMGKDAKDVGAILDELSKSSSVITQDLTGQLNAQRSLEQSLKGLNNTTQDYVNSLSKVTPLTKGASELFSSIGSMINSVMGSVGNKSALAATALGLEESNLSAISGIAIPERLQKAIQASKGMTAEEQVLALSTSEVFQDIVTYGIETGKELNKLARSASDAAVAQAQASKALRKLGEFEKAFGPSGIVAGRRVDLENASRGGELSALQEASGRLSRLLSSAYKQASSIGGAPISSESALSERITQLSTQRDDASKKALSDLLVIYGNINNTLIAQYEVQAQQKVIQLSMIDAAERRRKVEEANSAKTRNDTQTELKLKNELIDINIAELQIAARMDDSAAERTALVVAELQAQKDLNSVLANIAQLSVTLAEEQALLNSLGSQDRETAEAKVRATREELEAAKQRSQVSQQNLKLTQEEVAYRTKLINLQRMQDLGEARQAFGAAVGTDASLSSRSAAQEQIILGLQQASEARIATLTEEISQTSDQLVIQTKQLEIDRERLELQSALTTHLREQRSLLMKQAEQSGGVLSETYIRDVLSTIRTQLEDQERAALSIGDNFASGMLSAVDEVSSSITEMFVRGEFSARNMANAVRSVFSKVIADLAAQYLRSALVNLLGSAIGSFAGSFGGGSFVGPSTGTVQAAGLQASGATTYAIPGFEKGGIMTEYGPLKLQKYARGGVATGPQLALYGEGSKNEAYVPLPDNRTIPVTLTGETGNKVSIGDTNIQVTINTTTGESSTKTTGEGAAEMGKRIAEQVKAIVHKELLDQARPFGLLWSNK